MYNILFYILLILSILLFLILLILLIISLMKLSHTPNYEKFDGIEDEQELEEQVITEHKYYNTLLYPTSYTKTNKICYPELCPNNDFIVRTPNIFKVSLAITGGGPRTYNASIGYMRAINRLGYKNKAQYVSTVSGGSWFYGTYAFANSTKPELYTDKKLLGIDRFDPKTITLSNLLSDNADNIDYMGNRLLNKRILLYVLEVLKSHVLKNEISWNYAIGKMFLDHYGIDDDVPVALNMKHALNLFKRNKDIGKAIYLSDDSPFWLCNTTLLMEYIEQYPYPTVTLTPLYSGITQQITILGNTIGGFVVENFAYGNSSVPKIRLPISAVGDCSDMGEISVIPLANVRTLRDMIGSSSTAYASTVYSLSLQKSGQFLSQYFPPQIDSILQSYILWGNLAPIDTTSDSQCSYSPVYGCEVKPGYNPSSCTAYDLECYSNTAPQCMIDSDCTHNYPYLTCVNKYKDYSSMNCRSIYGKCKCITPSLDSSARVREGDYDYDKDEDALASVEMSDIFFDQDSKLGDGTFSDDTGILALLARGTRRIISFLNLADDNMNPNIVITDNQIISLFGLGIKADHATLKLNEQQVFDPDSYNHFILPQFRQTYAEGYATYARATLEVLPNKLFGVEGGFNVDILFILLCPSSIFISQLPADIQKEITYKYKKEKAGLFHNFPNFSTMFQNSDLGLIDYTLEQVNLLAAYTDWSLMQTDLREIIDDMFNS